MGYRIAYPSSARKHTNVFRCVRLPVLTVFSFALFILLVEVLWPEGSAWIRNHLWDDSIAASALNDLAAEWHSGEDLLAAFAAFCRKLVS